MAKQRQFDLHDGKTGSAITVRITPRAGKNEIIGVLEDGTVKIQLTVPSVENQANQALIQYLAEVLQVSPASIEIVVGHAGNDKLVTILNMDANTLQQRIYKNIA
jgi:uncharacterized protein (TIGR00251 family)